MMLDIEKYIVTQIKRSHEKKLKITKHHLIWDDIKT
jgi:hypothetical protein